MGGVAYLFFLRELIQRMEQDWPAVLADLEAVRTAVIRRAGLLCNVTVDQASFEAFQPQLAEFIAALPARHGRAREDHPTGSWQPTPVAKPEGLTLPAQVNYVGKGANLYRLGYELHGSTLVAVKFLDNTWLWDRVRVQGGAYGGFCTFDSLSGVLAFLSYRDPNLLGTLQTYDASAHYLRTVELTQGDVDKIIIGLIGQMDSYQLPDAKGLHGVAAHPQRRHGRHPPAAARPGAGHHGRRRTRPGRPAGAGCAAGRGGRARLRAGHRRSQPDAGRAAKRDQSVVGSVSSDTCQVSSVELTR